MNGEKRYNLHEEFKAHSKDDERRFEDTQKLLAEVQKTLSAIMVLLKGEDDEPGVVKKTNTMYASYAGVVSVKSIIVGIASVLIALGVIGSGVIYLLKLLNFKM